MDRPATLATLDGLVEASGAVVLFQTSHLNVPDNAWRDGFEAAVERATGSGRRQPWRQPEWVRHEAVLLDSPFSTMQRLGIVERLHTPVAHLTQRALSMSSTTRARLGAEGVARLTAEIADFAAAASRDGLVTEVVESVALIAQRPAS